MEVVIIVYILFQEMVKGNKLIFTFDATKKARFGVLPRYAKDELQIRQFELPSCFIFHNDVLIDIDRDKDKPKMTAF